jgi:Na+-driven multidrug efflux pump
MVDMYFVGTQLDATLATAGLAALSITGSVFNVVAALTYPLCSGTTAIIARTSSDQQRTQRMNLYHRAKASTANTVECF